MNDKKRLAPGFLLGIMLMSMVAGAMCLNKVSPLLTYIISDMHLNGTSQGGLLISVFAISGIFLSLLIGVIMQTIGYYKTGMIALAAIILGSVIGAFNISFSVMLISRIIEGVGLIMLTTIGPAVVTRAFTGKNLGAAMGVLMCFMTIGQIIMLNLSPRIAEKSTWRNVWWITAIYAFVLLILWFISLKNLDKMMGLDTKEKAKSLLLPTAVLANKKIWCIGLTFMLYLIAQQGVIAFLPTYLVTQRGISSGMAGSMVSIASVVGIPTAILTGVISDKINSRKKLIVGLLMASAIVYAVMPFFPTNLYGVIIAAYGVSVMGIVGLCMSAASELVAPEYGGMTVAFMNTMQWIGIFLSSSVFGTIISRVGYTNAFLILVPETIIAALLTAIIKGLK